MAIQIEQEKKPINWMGVASVAVVALLIFGGVYFIFFSRPDVFIEIIVPSELEGLEEITTPPFDPRELEELDEFRALENHGLLPIPTPEVGRENPFYPAR